MWFQRFQTPAKLVRAQMQCFCCFGLLVFNILSSYYHVKDFWGWSFSCELHSQWTPPSLCSLQIMQLISAPQKSNIMQQHHKHVLTFSLFARTLLSSMDYVESLTIKSKWTHFYWCDIINSDVSIVFSHNHFLMGYCA